MSTRTTRNTLVDRRLVEAVVTGVPSDLPEELVKYHLNHQGRLHGAICRALQTPLMRVHPEHLTRVRKLGGLFSEARSTVVLGGETLGLQARFGVIKGCRAPQYLSFPAGKDIISEPSLNSEVVYLPDILEGSPECTYEKASDIVQGLPKVEGLVWTIGNPPTIASVLSSHRKWTGEHLLPKFMTWTDATIRAGMHYRAGSRIVLGEYKDGMPTLGLVELEERPPHWGIGLFVLGVPDPSYWTNEPFGSSWDDMR